MTAASLRHSTISSIGWTVAQVCWSSGATFLLFVVLTRLLDPVAFGIFALSMVFVDVGRVLATAGLADAVVREADLSEETADTAFWANLAFAGLVMAAALALAGPYAAFMEQPEIGRVVSALALLMPVAALGSIHTARLRRAFGHKILTFRTMLATLAASLVAIGAAAAGAGVWSLVIQAAVLDVAQVALAFWTFRWRPRARFSVPTLRRLLGFSGSMVATQLLWLLNMRVPELFIGRALGVGDVGRFRIAWRLIELLAQIALTPMAGVSFLTLARVQADLARFRRIWSALVASAVLWALPAILGLGAVADDLIPLIFGQRWNGDGNLVRTLSVIALAYTVNGFVPSALGALGHSGALLRIAVAEIAITVLTAWAAAPYGLMAVAAAYVLRTYLIMPYQLILLRRYSGVELRPLARRLVGPAVAAGVMAVAVTLAHGAMLPLVSAPWPRVALSVALGVAVYAGLLLILARDEIRDVAAHLRPLLRRDTAGLPAS